MARYAEINRSTAETEVQVSLALDGIGEGERRTGVGFLDHMLDLFARHGRVDLTVRASGDLDTGAHHAIGAAFKALARALRAAVALDPTERGIPSTKGTLV